METVGLLGVLAMWGALGLLGCCATLVATRRPIAMLALPAAVIGAMAGALLVPALGGKGALGLAISVPVAPVAGAIMSWAIDRSLKAAA